MKKSYLEDLQTQFDKELGSDDQIDDMPTVSSFFKMIERLRAKPATDEVLDIEIPSDIDIDSRTKLNEASIKLDSVMWLFGAKVSKLSIEIQKMKLKFLRFHEPTKVQESTKLTHKQKKEEKAFGKKTLDLKTLSQTFDTLQVNPFYNQTGRQLDVLDMSSLLLNRPLINSEMTIVIDPDQLMTIQDDNAIMIHQGFIKLEEDYSPYDYNQLAVPSEQFNFRFIYEFRDRIDVLFPNNKKLTQDKGISIVDDVINQRQLPQWLQAQRSDTFQEYYKKQSIKKQEDFEFLPQSRENRTQQFMVKQQEGSESPPPQSIPAQIKQQENQSRSVQFHKIEEDFQQLPIMNIKEQIPVAEEKSLIPQEIVPQRQKILAEQSSHQIEQHLDIDTIQPVLQQDIEGQQNQFLEQHEPLQHQSTEQHQNLEQNEPLEQHEPLEQFQDYPLYQDDYEPQPIEQMEQNIQIEQQPIEQPVITNLKAVEQVSIKQPMEAIVFTNFADNQNVKDMKNQQLKDLLLTIDSQSRNQQRQQYPESSQINQQDNLFKQEFHFSQQQPLVDDFLKDKYQLLSNDNNLKSTVVPPQQQYNLDDYNQIESDFSEQEMRQQNYFKYESSQVQKAQIQPKVKIQQRNTQNQFRFDPQEQLARRELQQMKSEPHELNRLLHFLYLEDQQYDIDYHRFFEFFTINMGKCDELKEEVPIITEVQLMEDSELMEIIQIQHVPIEERIPDNEDDQFLELNYYALPMKVIKKTSLPINIKQMQELIIMMLKKIEGPVSFLKLYQSLPYIIDEHITKQKFFAALMFVCKTNIQLGTIDTNDFQFNSQLLGP